MSGLVSEADSSGRHDVRVVGDYGNGRLGGVLLAPPAFIGDLTLGWPMGCGCGCGFVMGNVRGRDDGTWGVG